MGGYMGGYELFLLLSTSSQGAKRLRNFLNGRNVATLVVVIRFRGDCVYAFDRSVSCRLIAHSFVSC